MTTRLLLNLLKKASLAHGKHGEAGFSMAVAMLVILTLILGTVAIASRTTSGLLGTNLQSKNREARDIAEAGIVQIVSELNKEQNRKMLVLGKAPANWSQGDADAINPCTKYNSSGTFNASSAQTPTATAVNFKSGWADLAGSNRQQFQLENVTYSDLSRATFTSPSDNIIKGIDKSLIKLTVIGRVRNPAGNVISTSRVTREFQVVPKCCKRSFGMNQSGATEYGSDTRICYNDGSSGGAGVITSLNGGTLSSTDNQGNNNKYAITIKDPQGNTVTKALCAKNRGDTLCDSGALQLATASVVPTPLTVTPPTFPGSTGNLRASITVSGSNKRYIRGNGANVETCSISNNGSLTGCTSIPSCSKVVDSYHCRMTSITLGGSSSLIMDTSNGPINFYFDDPSATTSTDYITSSGTQVFKQVFCGTPPSGASQCPDNATFAKVDNLNIYATGSGRIAIGGTSSSAGPMNIVAPNATVSVKGGGNADPNFAGRIWTNNLTVSGAPILQVPNSTPSFCSEPGASCPPPTSSPDIDWVARSVSQSSAF